MAQIQKIAFKNKERLIYWRRRLHERAEPAFQEIKTAAFLAAELKKMGLAVRLNVGGDTGLSALLETGKPLPVVALRADMDALPIVEQTGLPFASKNDGYMHACGHDAHMAMLLGVALIWTHLKDEFPGNLLLIFQPSEEKLPGGALGMLKAGVLADPIPKAIFALHVDPHLSTGKVGFKAGPLMAAADSFTLKVRGKGGHGAVPHQAVDAITISSNIIQAWQQVVSRLVDPLDAVVLSIGTIEGGSAFNIIAEQVEMRGTIRTLSRELREKMPFMLKKIATHIAAGFGASCQFSYDKGYPVLINDRLKTAILKRAATQLWGEEGALELQKPSMGADDMAYFLQEVPGSYGFLGAKDPHWQTVYSWHSPFFDLDENCLPLGAALLTLTAWLSLVQSPAGNFRTS